ncbi:MAG: hypothetical protein IKX62_06915 [Bacteroidales bacterium]|nr:hypothetical protein [Bacteroidales bacterium]
MKRSFADILQDLDGDRERKLARKLPEWAAVGAEVPSALALEQCSSCTTAYYKAYLAGQAAAAGELRASRYPSQPAGWAPPVHDATGGTVPPAALPAPAGSENTDAFSKCPFGSVLDLTGGMGVDSWAFSKVAERVVYFERDAELAAAAERNFARLGAGNIEVRCETVTPDTELPEADLIYADPARRDAAGRKVFLLEDCTPDILTLLPTLLRKAPAVLLKVSPMADLSMLSERLGTALREIHIVEYDGEVKELLCLLRHDTAPAEPEIVIARLSGQAAAAAKLRFAHPSQPLGWAPPVHDATGGTVLPAAPPDPESYLCFRGSEERNAEVRYAAEVRPGDILLEPCPALLKAGAFRLPCARWGLLKLAPSTHLYLLPGADPGHFAPGDEKNGVPGADTPSSAPGTRFPDGVEAWFKVRSVQEVLPFGAAAFKDLRGRFPQAEITARNLPLGSDALRKKMGIAPGGDAHIFACRLADARAALIVT